ncbi:MAG: M48 family metallopeptidase [Pyrinomonadaceae bacterium]
MKRLFLNKYDKSLTAAMILWAMLMLPFAAFGQTRIVAPKNKYKVQDDVKLGQQAARQVEQQMPILNDNQSTQYLQSVGERLVNAIPPEYQHPEFRYTFKIVNASDINAFALPGGPMFVNRGMIEAAQNEGEMAGVMAHELSHVALRHATAQATQQSSPLNQGLGIGSILLGAILGGQTGAVLGNTIFQGFRVLPFSREYETQADTLGAQIMARAGYDPRDLANMFRTIERQGGGGTPEFLSDHPNPENRYENINREASMLRVSPEPIKITQGFLRTKRYLQSLPPAPSTAQIEQGAQNGQVYGNGGGGSATSSGNYETRVEYPSSRTRTNNLGVASVNTPENWQVVNQSNTEIWFAPQGAFGNQGITRGAIVGIAQNSGGNLQQATTSYVQGILQGNNYLHARSNYSRATVGGRGGLSIVLSGTSPVSGATEIDTIYTTQLRDGSLFYVVTVAPQSEASNYNYAFRNMVRSIQINDR